MAIKSDTMEKTVKRLNELNILKNNFEDHAVIVHDNIMTFHEVQYSAPDYGIIYHAIYKEAPYLSYISYTNKRVEMQIRHDNGSTGYKKHKGNVSEVYGFFFGFSSFESRKEILHLLLTLLSIDDDSSNIEAPWSIRKRMFDFTND